MSKVSLDEVLTYGLKLIGYVFAIIAVSSPFLVWGIRYSYLDRLTNPFPFFDVILVFLGFVILISGLMGLLYKVVADGVERGNK